MAGNRMSQKTRKLVANSLLCRLKTDFDYAPGAVTPLKDICNAVKQSQLDYEMLAGAYFVQLHMHDNPTLKDEFDRALHAYLGDEYAMGFLIELGRLENAFNATRQSA